VRTHPVFLTDDALAEIVHGIEDPDVQDEVFEWLEDALGRFPRAHGRIRKLGPQARLMRSEGWTVIYDVDDQDPNDENGAEVWVRHVWPSRGQELDELARYLEGRRL
jgi:hypothetical protein